MRVKNLSNVCQQALWAVHKTAAYIKSEFDQIKSPTFEVKDYNSFVTEIDKKAEIQLVSALERIVPDAVFLTEEKTIANKRGDLIWIVDPLDGTTNFIHGIPIFSISVALFHKNIGLIGIVHDVIHESSYYAWKDGGAYLNGNSISVSNHSIIQDTLVATGFPYYDFSQMKPYLATLESLIENTRGLRRLGSAAIDLAYVASGKFDAFFEYGLKPWDVAAGSVLVIEAGGKVTNFRGSDEFLYKGEIIASSQRIFPSFLNIIQSNFIV